MFSVIWSIIKSSRYFLPFINEVIDEKSGDVSGEDLLRIQQLKKMLSLAIWRIIYLVIVVSIVYWGIIPLYTENAVLRQEVNERDKKIIEISEEARKAKNETRRVTESLIVYTNDLKSVTEDRNRLLGIVHECRDAEAQYRNYILDKEGSLRGHETGSSTSKSKSTTSPKTTKKEGSTVKPVLPDSLRSKLLQTE